MAGVGAKTICSLTLISDLVYGAAPSSRHRVRYNFAHGGTDGHPSPADQANHDSSIAILEQVLRQAKVSDTERLAALRRLASSGERTKPES